MKTKYFFFLISALILISMACRKTANTGVGIQNEYTLNYQNIERSYILYTPNGLDTSKPMPLVFVLHGGGGNAENIIRSSDFNEVADQNKALIVYPNGTGRLNDAVLTWNGGTCCGFAQENNIDDVGFIREILKDVESIENVDPKRIYATGMSNGGIMSYRLACEASDIFAAIGSVSGTLNFSPCTPTENVSIIHFHGTEDQHVPYDGGVGSQSLVGVDFASVQDSVNFWVEFNGCNSQPQTNSFEDVQHQAWEGCVGFSSVELYTIVGGKHAWPGSQGPGWVGGDEPNQTISATQLLWEFFASHPKP